MMSAVGAAPPASPCEGGAASFPDLIRLDCRSVPSSRQQGLADLEHQFAPTHSPRVWCVGHRQIVVAVGVDAPKSLGRPCIQLVRVDLAFDQVHALLLASAARPENLGGCGCRTVPECPVRRSYRSTRRKSRLPAAWLGAVPAVRRAAVGDPGHGCRRRCGIHAKGRGRGECWLCARSARRGTCGWRPALMSRLPAPASEGAHPPRLSAGGWGRQGDALHQGSPRRRAASHRRRVLDHAGGAGRRAGRNSGTQPLEASAPKWFCPHAGLQTARPPGAEPKLLLAVQAICLSKSYLYFAFGLPNVKHGFEIRV